ncbi:MAG: hypothetical protein AAGE84_06870 [Cyanobacteria bacterium P01_G01_bin.39]
MNNQDQSFPIKRISVANNGTQANGQSGSNSISDDGRFVTFESNATNLVAGDTNGQTDTFIYDSSNQTVELISIAPDGSLANGSSNSGSISGDGNYIAFASFADNLVPNDNNEQRDIFLYDRVNETTELISIASDGTQANGLSLFSTTNANGRYVVFESNADNLVANDTNGTKDIFVRDRVNQTTSRIKVGLNGAQANSDLNLGSISDDGRYISFWSDASNLVPGDSNGFSDVFVYDRVNQTTELVNSINGADANGASTSGFISGDGSYVVYESDASNLVGNDSNGFSDVFVYNRDNQTTELVSVASEGTLGNGDSRSASISDDGQMVAFLSEADNLVAADTNAESNVFVRDLADQTTKLLDGDSFPTLSGDGQSLIFNSSLSTLVSDDTNDTGDVFLVDLSSSTVEPPVVEPPVVEPPVVEPPVVEPPVVEPPVVEPPVVEPPVVEPPVVEPPVVNDLDRFAIDQIHRFYQFERGFHFYTTDDNEIDFIQEQSAAGNLSYQSEGDRYSVLSDDKDVLTGETLDGVTPVYRFFNTQTGAHFYTNDENEKNFVEDTLDNYNFEGIKYYAFESKPTEIETIPVFRMLNNDSGSHLYTINQDEVSYIQDNLPNFSLENNGDAVFHVFEL